jgi:lysophospholipase L1-like esterase
MKRIYVLMLVLFLVPVFNNMVLAQTNPPFFNDIKAFKKMDQSNPPEKGAILFVGSSSFTMWKDLQNYFPEYAIINRGFGGSSLPDVIFYASDIIYPYKPSQVVIYCGENDFAASSNTNADTVLNRFSKLFGMIRKEIPTAHILFISIKPSPSRAKYMPEMVRANELIKRYLKRRPRTGFVDVYNKMLLDDGNPMPEIFLSDKLHMNKNGYLIWQKAIYPYLRKKG